MQLLQPPQPVPQLGRSRAAAFFRPMLGAAPAPQKEGDAQACGCCLHGPPHAGLLPYSWADLVLLEELSLNDNNLQGGIPQVRFGWLVGWLAGMHCVLPARLVHATCREASRALRCTPLLAFYAARHETPSVACRAAPIFRLLDASPCLHVHTLQSQNNPSPPRPSSCERPWPCPVHCTLGGLNHVHSHPHLACPATCP